MKIYLLAACILLPLAAHGKTIRLYGDVQLNHLSPTQQEAIWIRAKQVPPMYPVSLAQKQISGCGIFKVNISETGHTESVEFVKGSTDKLAKPSRKLIKKWKWKPNGDTPAQAEEKLLRLDYCMTGTSAEEAQAFCVREAAQECSAKL